MKNLSPTNALWVCPRYFTQNLQIMRNIRSIFDVFAVLFLLLSFSAEAQDYKAYQDSINKLNYQNFVQMKKQLGITAENRPGPSGNPASENSANFDESKVKSYDLPEVLVSNNGKKITTAEDWWEIRRPEIVEDFETSVYGRLPENIPSVTWNIVSEKDTTLYSYPVTEILLEGVVDNSAYPEIEVKIELLVGIPKRAKEAVPMVMEFGFINSPFERSASEPGSYFASAYEPKWKQQVLSQNIGYAILVPNSIQADNGAGLTSGIIGLVNHGKPRKPEQWGALRAWGWGASRAMDYFETNPKIDENRIAVEGVSRYGKAAIVSMAFDDRISLGFFGSAGAGGTSLLRRNFGEQIENLASSGEYHWFCGNFIKYASALETEDLPVDAHQLVALCAPRPVFISSGSHLVEGQWVDAKGMFLAGVHATPVYELLGKSGLETSEFPKLGTALADCEIAFRQHAGGHSTGPNWSTWIAWASKHWNF